MEETYWKQFMTTGRVEDYLHFKQVSNIDGRTRQHDENRIDEKSVHKSKIDNVRESLK